MTPFTPEELKHEIKKLHPDKSPGPSGITNRMLQSGDTDLQGLTLIFFNGLWEFHTQPSDWQLSLRLFTLDTTRPTHTPSDPQLQLTSGLEVYSMLMT